MIQTLSQITPHPVDAVAATAGGFLRALKLEREVLASPWITIGALNTGAWINISPVYGTAIERLDLISKAADALGAGPADVRYRPNDAKWSIVEVAGDWAECPITVTTVIATTDLVDIETDRAVEATMGDLIENVARHYPAEDFLDTDQFDADERRLDALMDAARDGGVE